MRTILLLTMTFASAVVITAAAFSATGELARIAAVVNGELIFVHEVDEALRQANLTEDISALSESRLNELRNEMIEILIEERLLVQEVKQMLTPELRASVERQVEEMTRAYMERLRQNFPTPELMARHERETGLSWQQIRQFQYQNNHRFYLRNHVAPALKRDEVGRPTPEEIERYQRENPEFQAQEQIQVAHVLLRVPSDASEEDEARIRQEAEQVALRARTGTDFVTLVNNHSQHEESLSRNGVLPRFKRDELFSEFNALFDLEEGTITDPIRTRLGYHVVMILEKETPEERIWREKFSEVLRDWLDELREQAVIDNRLASAEQSETAFQP